ncbi:MAG: right-handed parallel beta-helix repeat-containing protein, partial [Anaerolineales bacterium]|nr:right-handed parallel beta-helix repeat-containing protein [Anaerolineales bacterium]
GMLLDSTISNHTVSTARFSGNAQHGLVFDGVSGGWFNGITSDDNTMDGIYVTNSGNNTFIDLTLYSNDDGLYLDEAGDSGNNTVQNSNISFNTNYGVRVEEDNVTMSNVTVHNNTAGGVVFNESVNHSVSGSTFENNTNNDIYFFYAADSQNDNIFTTMTTGNATYSLTQEGKITLAGATSPTPAGTYISTYKSLNLTLEGAGGWAYLNITYTNADLNDTGINESSMRMMRYDGATWTDTPGNTTNELNNYEHANISAFNYIYMALGNDTEAPEWVELPSGTKANPTDQSVECDVAFEYNVNATDNKDVHKYGVNNTVNFSITEAGGVLTNTTYLGLGILGLNLSVNDTPANNINYSTISLTVNDTVDPAWNPQPESQVVSYGAAFEYDVDATDTCSVAELTYGIDDEVNFAIVSSTGVISAASLAIGSYPLTIDVNDS